MNTHSRAITRRDFLRRSIAGSATLLGASRLCAAEDSPERPPNFVIIFCDDLGYGDVGCFGSSLIRTPRIDKMAAEGTRFTDFYAAAPVCTPSRAALMTGCYPIRINLPAVLNTGSMIGIHRDEVTLAELLKTRGYTTACVGKWHLGHLPPFLPTRHGFDRFFGLPYSNDMGKPIPVPLYSDERIIEQPVVQETLTERYTQESIRFITENRDRPFFLYLAHTFPHVPLHVSERFKGKSKGGLFGDVVECIDRSTGEILDALRKLGLDENTLIVFTSDNGPWLQKAEHGGSAGPLRAGKGTTWEGGMREPCIMRWPGRIPAGKLCSEPASTIDIFPTFARLAGAAVPTDRIIDGRDIWPVMAGREGAKNPREAFFYYWRDELQAVRCGKWKLVLARQAKQNAAAVPEQLFDLQADTGETTDMSARYPTVAKRLRAMAERCREDIGDALAGTTGRNRRPAGKVE